MVLNFRARSSIADTTNVFYPRVGHPCESATRLHNRVACSNLLFATIAMPPIRHEKRQKSIEQEGRMELTIQAIKNEKVISIREAAQLFDVPRSTLQDRLNGRVHRPIQRANNTKLTVIEEDALEDWILDLDSRGKAPSYMMVKDMANILLAERPRFGKVITVGKNWVYKFVKRRDTLKGQFSHRYNT